MPAGSRRLTCRRPAARCLDNQQVQHGDDRAEQVYADRDDHGGDVDGDPVRLKRGHQLAGRGVDRPPRRRPARARPAAARTGRGSRRGTGPRRATQYEHGRAGDRGDELVHVAPGHAVLGQSPGRDRDDVQRQPGAGQQEGAAQPQPCRPRRLPDGRDRRRQPSERRAVGLVTTWPGAAGLCRRGARSAEVGQLGWVCRVGGERVPGQIGTARGPCHHVARRPVAAAPGPRPPRPAGRLPKAKSHA